MIKTYLTYSRNLGDFKPDLVGLSEKGLYGLRLIHKGKSTEEFIARIQEILTYNQTYHLNLEILVDLPGEKPLIGNVGTGFNVEKGRVYNLCDEKPDLAANEIPTLNFLTKIERTKVFPGDICSIADGEVDMKIISMDDRSITCEALNSFFLTSNRSFGIKGNKLPARPISKDDRQLLEELKSLEISKVIKILVSFVTKADQVTDVKKISPDFQVISKVENVIPESDLEEIIQVSDGIMLGRGDLISTSKMSDVFPFQKSVIEKCHALKKDLILATGFFGDLKNSGKPSISDLMDFGFLRNMNVESFLIAGSNANQYPVETLNLITNFEVLDDR
nr:pyruvate kinase [uncultured Fluviicola sp.]